MTAALEPLTELAIALPTARVTELLARAEELASLVQACPRCQACDPIITDRLRALAHSLHQLDQYGLLRGPIRTRYLAAIASVSL